MGSCYTIVTVGTYIIIALNNSGGIGWLQKKFNNQKTIFINYHVVT